MIEKYMILTNNIQFLKTYFNKLEWRIYKMELYMYTYSECIWCSKWHYIHTYIEETNALNIWYNFSTCV